MFEDASKVMPGSNRFQRGREALYLVNTKTLYIGLVFDRIDVLLCHGERVIASRRLKHAIDPDPDKWVRSVKDAARVIKGAVDELAARGLPARVLYHSPTECSEHAAIALKSASDASQAALLSCADAFPCPLDLTANLAISVGRDVRTDDPQTHVIVAADRDDAVTALVSMVREAGLRFESATPVAAVILGGLCAEQLQRQQGFSSRLYVGEFRSFFVIAEGGSIHFARSINLGLDSMVSALTKPIRTTSEAPCVLDRQTAATILFTHGLPDRAQVVHEPLGLVGAQITPLLAPVLQRFIVELRQSLRFGVPEIQRSSIKLQVEGPGAGVPGFITMLASELSLAVHADEASSKSDLDTARGTASDVFHALKHRRMLDRLGLQPNHMIQSRTASRQKRWLWTGAAAALMIIAAEYGQTHRQMTLIQAQAHTAASQSADLQQLQSVIDKVSTAKTALASLEASIRRETGATMNPRACLQELAAVTPESIRLTGMNFYQHGQNMVGLISGYAIQPEGSSGRPQLEPFIERLRRSPLFESVVLANVQMGSLGEVNGQRFETSVVTVKAPRESDDEPMAITTPDTASASSGKSNP